MNVREMSDQFDLLYNNITSNQAPGLTEYEKSVFLTKAQDEIIKNHFNPKGNKYQEGFDDNQKRQIDFSSITAVFEAKRTDTTPKLHSGPGKFDKRTSGVGWVELPNAMMFINEHLTVTRGTNGPTVELTVKPISFDEYDRLMSKPFKRPLNYQAWRLITHATGNTGDLIAGSTDVLTAYVARYIKQPTPIILGDLDGLTINGYKFTGQTYPADAEEIDGECKLDPMMHEEILQRAVELAKIAWTNTGQDNLQAVIQAGQRSE